MSESDEIGLTIKGFSSADRDVVRFQTHLMLGKALERWGDNFDFDVTISQDDTAEFKWWRRQ